MPILYSSFFDFLQVIFYIFGKIYINSYSTEILLREITHYISFLCKEKNVLSTTLKWPFWS